MCDLFGKRNPANLISMFGDVRQPTAATSPAPVPGDVPRLVQTSTAAPAPFPAQQSVFNHNNNSMANSFSNRIFGDLQKKMTGSAGQRINGTNTPPSSSAIVR